MWFTIKLGSYSILPASSCKAVLQLIDHLNFKVFDAVPRFSISLAVVWERDNSVSISCVNFLLMQEEQASHICREYCVDMFLKSISKYSSSSAFSGCKDHSGVANFLQPFQNHWGIKRKQTRLPKCVANVDDLIWVNALWSIQQQFSIFFIYFF